MDGNKKALISVLAADGGRMDAGFLDCFLRVKCSLLLERVSLLLQRIVDSNFVEADGARQAEFSANDTVVLRYIEEG